MTHQSECLRCLAIVEARKVHFRTPEGAWESRGPYCEECQPIVFATLESLGYTDIQVLGVRF